MEFWRHRVSREESRDLHSSFGRERVWCIRTEEVVERVEEKKDTT